MINHPAIVAHVVDTSRAARDYAICINHDDPITVRAYLTSHAYERAKSLTGNLSASYDPRVFINESNTIASIALVVDGWYVRCVINLVTGRLVGVPDDERKPSMRRAS